MPIQNKVPPMPDANHRSNSPGPDTREHRIAYIIDDEREVRVSLTFMLKTFGIASRPFATAEDFLEEVPALRPGCVVVDVRMPMKDGISMLAEMRSAGNLWPVIVITGHADVKMAVRALKLGASEFLEKPFREDELLSALERGFELLEKTHAHREMVQEAEAVMGRLTARERLVLEKLMAGLSSKQVAEQLGLSPRTVEMHRANMLRRAGVGTLVELIAIAHAAGVKASSRLGVAS